jgi:hypothetical protein
MTAVTEEVPGDLKSRTLSRFDQIFFKSKNLPFFFKRFVKLAGQRTKL